MLREILRLLRDPRSYLQEAWEVAERDFLVYFRTSFPENRAERATIREIVIAVLVQHGTDFKSWEQDEQEYKRHRKNSPKEIGIEEIGVLIFSRLSPYQLRQARHRYRDYQRLARIAGFSKADLREADRRAEKIVEGLGA